MAETFETIEARSLLEEEQYTEALRVLEKIPAAERDGEWYFLRSRVEEGMECYYNSVISLKKAVELSPDSKEYKKALKEMQKKSKETSRKKAEWRQVCSAVPVLSATAFVTRITRGARKAAGNAVWKAAEKAAANAVWKAAEKAAANAWERLPVKAATAIAVDPIFES